MGVSTIAIIKKGTSLKEIKEVLEANYGEVNVYPTHDSNFFKLAFTDSNDNRNNPRSMSVFLDNLAKIDHRIDGVLLSLGCLGNSVEIMKKLLDVFGGYLDENDCDSNDFYPINLDEYNKGKDVTEIDLLTNEIIQKLGYEKLDVALELFETYRKLKP